MTRFNTFGIIASGTVLITVSILLPALSQAANLTVVKDTLSSSRISFAGRVAAPTSAGSTNVYINSTGAANFYSISTAGLKPGDAVTIGSNSYNIASIINSSQFSTTSVLQAGDADVDDPIYFLSRPQHVITFKTASAIPGGFFRVLIPAGEGNSADSLPDPDGFDIAAGSPTLAGTNVTGYTFVTTAATASGGTNCPAGFHCFEYHYINAGAPNTDITLSVGNVTGTLDGLIAPAPKSDHATGSADIYTFRVQNFSNASDPTLAPADSTSGRVGIVESVRVSATVDPSLTFSIDGVVGGTSACGTTTTAGIFTTPDAVPFGVMALNTFKILAQTLTVSTNAVDGYVVTASQSGALSNLAASPSFIPDATCDNGLCTDSVAAAWGTATGNPGFGYTLGIVTGASVTINPTAGNYMHFPSVAQTPHTIMSSPTVADADAINVCYKLAIDATQPAGNYENQVTYTATAAF